MRRPFPSAGLVAQNVRVPRFTVAPSTVVGGTPTDTFEFAFPFWSAADIIVKVDGLALDPSDYAVTGLFIQFDENGDPIEVEGGYGSGVVTLETPVTDCVVTLDRFVVGARETVFAKNTPLPMTALNADLNKNVARQQDLERRVNSVQAGEVDPAMLVEIVEATVGDQLGAISDEAAAATAAAAAATAAVDGKADVIDLNDGLALKLNTADAPTVIEDTLDTVLPPLIAGKASVDLEDVEFAAPVGGSPGGAQALRFKLGDFGLRPEDYGAVGDGVADDADAIDAMEADAGPYDICRFNKGPYRHTRPLKYTRTGMVWLCDDTEFVYDPPVLGDAEDDAAQLRADNITFGDFTTVQLLGCRWEGIAKVSCTRPKLNPNHIADPDDPDFIPLESPDHVMSAAIRWNNTTRSQIVNCIDDGQEDDGNNYNGLFFNAIDSIKLDGTVPRAANDGIIIVGQLDESDPYVERALGAGLYLDNYKIGGCGGAGVRIGGGFGGIYFGKGDIPGNTVGVSIDQTVVDEPNREVMFGPTCSLDVNDEAALLIDQDDARLYVGLSGTWIASTQNGPGVYVKRCPNATIAGTPFLYQNKTDGLLLAEPTALVTGLYTCRLNGRPGGTDTPLPTVGQPFYEAAHPGWSGVRATNQLALGGPTSVPGLQCSAAGYDNGTGGSRLITSEATPAHAIRSRYQAIAKLDFVEILGVLVRSEYLKLQNGENTAYLDLGSVADGSGTLQIAHGDSNLPARAREVSVSWNDGGGGGGTTNFVYTNIAVNGTLVGSTVPVPAAAGKIFRIRVWFAE